MLSKIENTTLQLWSLSQDSSKNWKLENNYFVCFQDEVKLSTYNSIPLKGYVEQG